MFAWPHTVIHGTCYGKKNVEENFQFFVSGPHSASLGKEIPTFYSVTNQKQQYYRQKKKNVTLKASHSSHREGYCFDSPTSTPKLPACCSTQQAPRGTVIMRQRADKTAMNEAEVMAAGLWALQHLNIAFAAATAVADDDVDPVSSGRAGLGGEATDQFFN